MTEQQWIPLTDYSAKYKVSISTLRRRIKSEDIRYSFSDGRYLLVDEPPSSHTMPDVKSSEHRPSQSSENSVRVLVGEQTESPLGKAQQLLNDLKTAYSTSLQEKEEVILRLQEEIVDLKTLVSVFDSENERLKNRLSSLSN